MTGHRRGELEPAQATGWVGWARYACTDDDCDWAVYVAPNGTEYAGYIPSPSRPGNRTHPGQVLTGSRPYLRSDAVERRDTYGL